MSALTEILWTAALVQIAIAATNVFLPRKLRYRENLERVAPIIRQIFVVHSVYIVGVLLLFAAITLGFAFTASALFLTFAYGAAVLARS